MGDTKTYHSKRTIEIRPSLLSELQTHLKYQNDRKLVLVELYSHDLNLVCREDETPLPKSTTFNAFKGYFEEIGHSFCQSIRPDIHMLSCCLKLVLIWEKLGHGSMQITSDVYAHVSKKIAARSIDKFDEYIKKLNNFVVEMW